jgi:hypothetical protein
MAGHVVGVSHWDLLRSRKLTSVLIISMLINIEERVNVVKVAEDREE